MCGQIDFQERAGEECLASNVDWLLQRIRAKYAEYGIDEKPFVIVKADAGTYGMGIMTVRDASEVQGLNRKQRNKMAVVKEGLEVTSVIIQEGVPTYEAINDAIAEPVVYMIDRYVVGGFYQPLSSEGRSARGVIEEDADPRLATKGSDRMPAEELEELLAAAARAAEQAVDEIRAGGLVAKPGSCAWKGGCAYPTICRAGAITG